VTPKTSDLRASFPSRNSQKHKSVQNWVLVKGSVWGVGTGIPRKSPHVFMGVPKMTNRFSRQSPYISNTFSWESPKWQRGFHVSKQSPRHSKQCPGKLHKSGDPYILSLVSSVSGVSESRHTCEWVMSHMWVSHVTHVSLINLEIHIFEVWSPLWALVSGETGSTKETIFCKRDL